MVLGISYSLEPALALFFLLLFLDFGASAVSVEALTDVSCNVSS